MKVVRPGLHEVQKKWLVTCVTLLFIGLVEQQTWLAPLRGQVQIITTPILAGITQRFESLMAPMTFFRNKGTMVRRLAQLEYEHAQALATISDLQREAQETTALRELLAKSSLTTKQIITAARVSYAQPEIAAGTRQGVQEQMLVLVAQTLIGKVQRVDTDRATVRLLSDPREKSIIAVTDSGAQGLIAGDGQAIFLSLVPQDKQVVVGEKVVTIGQEYIPAGVFIGTVAETVGDPAEPTKQLRLEQYVSFFSAPLVTVR